MNVGFETVWPRVFPALFTDEVFKDRVIWTLDTANVFPSNMLFLFLNCLARWPVTLIQESIVSQPLSSH